MNLSTDPGLLLLAYTAQPGSISQDGLQLLANWAATNDQAARTSPVSMDATDGV
jgi:hypothetical protein